jgi:2-deoxy-D-gluconate 3-dehydrogenase
MKKGMIDRFNLDGKVAIVTGGNGGIGEGIGRGLAEAGANIVIAARNEAKTAQACARIKADFGVETLGIRADIRQEQDNNEMVKQALDRFRRVDILVCNAGMGIAKPPQNITVAEWDEIMETNLRSFFVAAKAAYPAMMKVGGGKVISVGSTMSIFGGGYFSPYAASKGGILQLTKSLAIAWAKNNIQVNCILPGWINSEMSVRAKSKKPDLERNIIARTPAGRWGEPEDFAGIAVFLASHASDFITGTAISVDGGYAVQIIWD